MAEDPNLDEGDVHDVIPATGIEIAVETLRPESDRIDEETASLRM